MAPEPHWTAYVQALGTPFVALIAGGIASAIAYQHWRLARAKVVLDLFEKRMEVYNLVIDSIHTIVAVGSSNIDHKITQPFASGLHKSKFLFGPKVYSYLDETFDLIFSLKNNSRKMNRTLSDEDFDKLDSHDDYAFSKILIFQKKFDAMVYPYMRADEKK